MTVGNVAALTQGNIKRMLAYSSIAHAGYILIGIVVGPPRGIEAALVYLAVYAFMQLGAFAVVVMLRRKDVIGDELKDLTGLYATHPGAAVAMLIFMLSLGGIPPTAGFMGKLWLFGAAIESGYIGLAVIGVINSALSLYYYVRVVVFMWIAERSQCAGPQDLGRDRDRPDRDRRRHPVVRHLPQRAVRPRPFVSRVARGGDPGGFAMKRKRMKPRKRNKLQLGGSEQRSSL